MGLMDYQTQIVKWRNGGQGTLHINNGSGGNGGMAQQIMLRVEMAVMAAMVLPMVAPAGMEGMDKYLLSKLIFTVLLGISLSSEAALNIYSHNLIKTVGDGGAGEMEMGRWRNGGHGGNAGSGQNSHGGAGGNGATLVDAAPQVEMVGWW